jgi:hypothetical protein
MTQLPPLKAHGVEIQEIESKRAQMNENRHALRQAEVRLQQLENSREQAKQEDVKAAVAAKRKGQKDPGDKNANRLEKQIQLARREVDVLRSLQTELEQESWELMREHSAEIIRALNENLKNLNAIQLKAISQLETVRAERQGTLRALEMVGGFVPTEVPEAQGPGQHYTELALHHTRDSVFKMDDQVIARVMAQLKGEAGFREELEAIAEQEQGTVDVFFPGTASLPRPAGYERFMERKAEREAERNGG